MSEAPPATPGPSPTHRNRIFCPCAASKTRRTARAFWHAGTSSPPSPATSSPDSSTCTPTASRPPSSTRATTTRLSAVASSECAASTPSTTCATTPGTRSPKGRCGTRVPLRPVARPGRRLDGELCPGVDIQAVAIDGTDSVRLSYGFDGPRGTRRRPTNVGFGLTYALPIVVACLTAEPGSLVLLENPEAHLHPRGQSRIAGLSRRRRRRGAADRRDAQRPRAQRGAARRQARRAGAGQSRSALLPERRHGQRGDQPRIDRDGMLDQWPEGFFDEVENLLDELLT
ncbi:DUF3696 domain-containing protein [Streptomyces sp. M10(2022)]